MSLKSELIEACHKVYNKGFVSAYDGNLSVRTNSNTFIITPSGKCKGELLEKDLLEIDSSGKIISGKGIVSSESKLHLLIYKKRNDINSIVHCHPVHATAFATAGKSLVKPIFPEVILNLGPIPLCKYETPSTQKFANSVLPFIKNSWALLLENHGAVTLGNNIKEAYYRMEKLEHTAHILIMVSLIGKEKVLSKKKLMELISIADYKFGIKINRENFNI